MPSLSDSLSALSDYTQQILLLSSSNLQPSGPYTTAYLDSLHLNPASSSSSSSSSSAPSKRPSRTTGGVLSLIRDAQESETRLFRFIGEAEVAGVGRVKKVEKRDNIGGKSGLGGDGDGMGVGKGRDEVEVMLRTALRLVDDYRPMPRARATITSLLETHHTQLERVAELELQIEEASNPIQSAPPPSGSASHSKQANKGTAKAKSKMSFEEAVKAEEAILKGMEAELGPLRRAREAASTSAPSSPPNNSIQGFSASSTLASSPPKPAPVPLASRTPAKTPMAQPKITNSLVNGTTPRRARATPGQSEALTEGFGFEFDRFSPLKFLGTPRARARVSARSNLGGMGDVGMESPVGKGIFGKRSVLETPSKGVENVQGLEPDEDQTIRIGSGLDTPQQEEDRATEPPQEVQQAMVPQEEQQPVIMEKPESPKAVKKEKEGYLEGVQVRLPIVVQAIAKLQEGLPEMMRQGLADGQEPPSSIESTITHLIRLSRSDPDPPPSPSSHSTSTLSSAPSNPSAPKPPPITPTTILVAHILLAMLRGEGVSTSMPDLKEDLGAIARARGWEGDGLTGAGGGGGGGLATKCIYHVVAKRVARIDRKGRGSVLFAI